MSETKDLRRLVIKTFHIEEVTVGEKNEVSVDGWMKIDPYSLNEIVEKEPAIHSVKIELIPPYDHERFTNTIMDVIPISTKVLGEIGEGITHTLTGVCAILTGVDVNGIQTAEFGSSEGILKEQVKFGRAGTPEVSDYIISIDVTFEVGQGQERSGVTAAHRVCDMLLQRLRDQMKMFNGNRCTERHEYHDIVRTGKKRVLIIKQVAGQGAMYDTHLFAKEPSGVEGGRSIIDMGNMPVIVTPNEYRDGIIRSMQ